jgi:hypothetical protein
MLVAVPIGVRNAVDALTATIIKSGWGDTSRLIAACMTIAATKGEGLQFGARSTSWPASSLRLQQGTRSEEAKVGFTRREMLRLTVAGAGAAAVSQGCAPSDSGDGWQRGPLKHLIPTASHRAFNIKLSFFAPRESAPVLHLSGTGRAVLGERMDSHGSFWAFRVGDLEPATTYSLELRDGGSEAAALLCDAWPLRTLPQPGAHAEKLRVISFTCAGGPNLPTPPSIFHAFKPAAYRQRLFDLMLERAPDLVIANGDHVYFDLPQQERLREGTLGSLVASLIDGVNASFDPSLPALGSTNESALATVGDDQIASIYGVRFRSTPVFFVTDDHDYFDNDDATPERITMPPDAFHMSLRNSLQRLYFPEFIVDSDAGFDLPGRIEAGGLRLSTHFGEVRYGDLFRALFYDCSGYLSLDGESGLVPPAVEAWLVDRTRTEDTAHLVHSPSHPFGWTAGKWREWYPDLLETRGSLLAEILVDEDGNKYEWKRGWWDQHQRLLEALASQSRRAPLILSGDLHALGAVRIERSGDLDLGANPVHSALSGPVGVGDLGWPSRARGVDSRIPRDLDVAEILGLEERNGFSVIDFEPESAVVDLLGCPQGWTDPSRLSVASAAQVRLRGRQA